MSFSDLLHPVSMGIALGLFAGKQLGVFLLCMVAIKLGMEKLPEGASWGALYGVAILSGVGFTMSLFIDTLAFENLPADAVFDFDARLGILLGSLASGVLGYIVLDRTLPKAGQ
jgi:NhaA family Na+:H+ antiporter